MSEITELGYELAEEVPPLGTVPVLTLKLDRAFMFATRYALSHRRVSQDDRPATVPATVYDE